MPERLDESQSVLVAEGVTRDYVTGSVVTHALRDVSLSLQRGTVTTLMGPSGCGKSTLLHVLSGLDRPTTGRVLVRGNELAAMPEAELAALRANAFGFVLQRDNLVPSLTAEENVATPLIAGGMGRRQALARAGEMLDRVGLTGKARSWPAALSGGEAQRVALARACVNRPTVLFADEPTGALDSTNTTAVLELIVEMVQGHGVAAFVVTHEHDVAAIADERLTMRDGRLT